jgi:hypothetical protein
MQPFVDLKSDAPLLLNWSKEEEKSYSENQLINAFQAGIDHGLSEKDRIIKKQFNENLQNAQKESEVFVNKLAEKFNIEFSALHLRPESLSNFTSLIILSLDDYLSDNMVEINNFAFEFSDKVNNEDFNLDFIFTYWDESLKRDSIISDGYILKYDK